jgi:hypothetical protein
MPDALQNRNEREARMRNLAGRLQFTVEEIGGHFTLTRTADLSDPARKENLTLAEAEKLLQTWTLRGLGGG